MQTIQSKWKTYPTFVECPMETEGPTTVPDPIWTSTPSTEFACTIAPVSIRTVESMHAVLWKIPPPLCHLTNSDECREVPSSDSIIWNRNQVIRSATRYNTESH